MWRHLLPLSLAEWRHHPWRHGVALLAVALGVALASSVQIINHSALAEFSQALRSVGGQPDVVLAARQPSGMDQGLVDVLSTDERVATASPVLELDTQARATTPNATRTAMHVVGVDALQAAALTPDLLPRPSAPTGAATASAPPQPGALQAIDPALVWLNAAARAHLKVADGELIELQSPHAGPSGWLQMRVGGAVAATGAPLVVLDISAVQRHFGRLGKLSRIDIRLAPGVDRELWLAQAPVPDDAQLASAQDAQERLSTLSRAYRVNLGVLAMVALLVGGFLVYSVLSLSVAQRTPQLALLGVLGLSAGQRQAWILVESALVGAAGSVIGLGLGTGLARLALGWMGGDLGGGYFPGMSPTLSLPAAPLAACGLLGCAAAVAGAWWPARQAAQLQPAQALKGLGQTGARPLPRWPAPVLLAAGGLLALAPAVGGLPLAAYASVALLLAGGVVAVPWGVQALLSTQRKPSTHVLAWLAWRRAYFARSTASATVAGVVASLALSVALTVMVGSFRSAVTDWLDVALPADVYARSGAGTATNDFSALPPALAASATQLPGVARAQVGRSVGVSVRANQPTVTLLARPLPDPERNLAMLGSALDARPGELGIFVSEAAVALYGWRPGELIRLPLPGLGGTSSTGPVGTVPARVRGVWRDYARQFGTVAMDLADFQRLTGDLRISELALWLQPGAAAPKVESALRALAGADHPLDVVTAAELRRLSLNIFDRSFAVTSYLQWVAMAVGLVGVAASLSAQVLARRKEFGLLAHLGFTRAQAVALVALETALWLLVGCLVGIALGLLVSMVLVWVVNPQSFHWTMPLRIPAVHLLGLAAAVLAAGGLTAAASARHAASRHAVQAVKEDW